MDGEMIHHTTPRSYTMRFMQWTILPAAALAAVCLVSPVRAAPFFQPQGNSFTPQIDVVSSGALLDVQGTVSADRKYVTITARPQLSNLVALRDFTFQNGNNGTVGLPGTGPGAGGG